MTWHEFGSSLVTKDTKDALYDSVEEMYVDGNKEEDNDGAAERAGGEVGTKTAWSRPPCPARSTPATSRPPWTIER